MMAVLFIDSFDHADTQDYGGHRYTNLPAKGGMSLYVDSTTPLGYSKISVGTGRRGSNSVIMATTETDPGSGIGIDFSETEPSPPIDEVVVGLAVRVVGEIIQFDPESPRFGVSIVTISNSHFDSVGVYIDEQRQLYVRYRVEANHSFEYLPYTVPFNTWIYVEVKARLSVDTDGVFDVRVDNTMVFSRHDVTALEGTGPIVRVTIFPVLDYNTYTVHIDDLYILETGSGQFRDFLGDSQVVALRPRSPGSYSEWFPAGPAHNQDVDDTFPDETVTYLFNTDINGRETYRMEASPIQTGAIRAVQQLAYATQDHTHYTPQRRIRNIIKHGNTVFNGRTYNLTYGPIYDGPESFPSDYPPQGAYKYYMQLHEVNPLTSLPWTFQELYDVEFGIESVP